MSNENKELRTRGWGGKDDFWLVNLDDMIYRLEGLPWQGLQGRVTL